MAETITVTQLNNRVKSILSASESVNDIWVTGELSNVKRYPTGHYYFTLKDSGSEIRGVMFKYSRQRIDFEPVDSMKVAAFGRADMYVERGSYQFVVETMQKSGVGELYQEYERLKKKLESEGLFEMSRKRKLPIYPKTIGVVTSSTGAVIHDIITTSGRRFPADILLAPAQVQGEGAAASIVAGIELLNRVGVDVIIVGRGGGSIEDLWAFNEEPVARAIVASEIPIISAVGHESDYTIADLVADVRAPTPTGAAELALRDKYEIIKQLNTDTGRLNRTLSGVIERMRGRFKIVDSKLDPRRAAERVARYELRLESLSTTLSSLLKQNVDRMQRRLSVPAANLEPAMRRSLESRRSEIKGLSDRLDGLNPYNVLGRGYSFVADEKGKALTSVTKLKEGTNITVRMRDGRADAEVKKVEVRK